MSCDQGWEPRSSIPLDCLTVLHSLKQGKNFIGNLVFGSKTYGKTRDGRKEWYMIKGISLLSKAYGENKGKSFGTIEYHKIPTLFGFSEPPKRPSSVKVVSLIEKTRLDV